MNDTPQTARDDLPAIAAYAKHHGLEAEAAATEWRFLAEKHRAHWRLVADGQGAGLADGDLYDAEFAADAASLDTDPSAADSGTALYLSAIARLSAGLRDVQHACERGDAPHAIAPIAAAALADVDRLRLLQPPPPEALDIAWNALHHIALHGDGKSAAKARETLRAVNEYLEDGTTEDGIDRTPRTADGGGS